MEHRLAQRRMLICAAFFSFGTCSGALTVVRLSEAAAERAFSGIAAFFSQQPMLRVPAAAILVILLLLLGGPGVAGICTLCMLLSSVGFFGGFIACLAVRAGCFSAFSFAFFALFAVCVLQMGSGILRRASASMHPSRGKPGKTDFRYELPRVACAAAVLLLTSACLAYYLLNR